jgi:hypothetical protein
MNKKKKINYDGWELKFFDKSKNFRNYQLKLIQKYVKGYIAEVGPGNGMNASSYINYPKKIDLYEPTKKLYLELKKRFKKKIKYQFIIKNFSYRKKSMIPYYI